MGLSIGILTFRTAPAQGSTTHASSNRFLITYHTTTASQYQAAYTCAGQYGCELLLYDYSTSFAFSYNQYYTIIWYGSLSAYQDASFPYYTTGHSETFTHPKPYQVNMVGHASYGALGIFNYYFDNCISAYGDGSWTTGTSC